MPPKANWKLAGQKIASILFLVCAGRLWADPVVWEGTANVAPGGWGRMIALPNGNWLAVSTAYPSGTNSFLSLLVSSNACRNWTAVAQVKEPGRTLDNGELVQLPGGYLLLTMRSLLDNGTSFRLPVYVSRDQGRTWTYLSNIDSSGGPGGLWEPDFLVLSNGTLAVFYSNETHPGYSQIVSERVSADGGTNWAGEIWVSAQLGGGNLRPGMPQITPLANGSYLLVNEVVNLGNADVYYKISADGVTWDNSQGIHIPCQHAGPFVTASPDGQVFVTSCQNEVSFSRDFGATWQRMETPPWGLGFNFSWPAIYLTGSGGLASMVTWSGVNLRFGKLMPLSSWPNPFRDNFETVPNTNWTHYGGNFFFTNGACLLNDTNSYGKVLAGSEFWTDGTLETDLQIRSPGNAGVVFRMTNPDYTGPDDGFGYYAGLDTGGFVIFGMQNNAWHPLASASMPVAMNTWYHFKVVMQGARFTIFASDMATPKVTFTDTTWTRGQVGLRAFNCNASFDNVVFTNAVPVRLSVAATSGALAFNWPLCPVNVKLFGSTNLEPRLNGSVIPINPSLVNTQWMLTLPQSAASRQFFWLQGQ
jgi:hypothetical protein